MAFQPAASMFLYNSRAEMHWSAGCSRALLAAQAGNRSSMASIDSHSVADNQVLQPHLQQHQQQQQQQQQQDDDDLDFDERDELVVEELQGDDGRDEVNEDAEPEEETMEEDETDEETPEVGNAEDEEEDEEEEAEQETALNLSLPSKRPNQHVAPVKQQQIPEQHHQQHLHHQAHTNQHHNQSNNHLHHLQHPPPPPPPPLQLTTSGTSNSYQHSNIKRNTTSDINNHHINNQTPNSLTSHHLNNHNHTFNSAGSSSASSSSASSSYSDWSSAADSLASCSPERTGSISSTTISVGSLLHPPLPPHQLTNQAQQQQPPHLQHHHNQHHHQAARQPFMHHHHHHHHHHHELGPSHKTDSEDLDRIRNFIEQFKARRGALGLTQKQAAQCFRAYTNDRYAFSDNFVGHFEGFQFRPQTAMTIADSLAEWLEFAENETRQGRQLSFMPGKVKETRKRKYEVIRIRDSAKRVLVEAFEKNKSPSTSELEQLSRKTNIPSRNIEIFFKNRRTSRQYHQ